LVSADNAAMATFIQIGRHWINLDQIASIELVESRKTPGTTSVARVHYSAGNYADFKTKDTIDAIEAWLQQHQME